jgi:hypothetical protein
MRWNMNELFRRLKRLHAIALGGRGVTVARRTFNPGSVGSNPSGPMERLKTTGQRLQVRRVQSRA